MRHSDTHNPRIYSGEDNQFTLHLHRQTGSQQLLPLLRLEPFTLASRSLGGVLTHLRGVATSCFSHRNDHSVAQRVDLVHDLHRDEMLSGIPSPQSEDPFQ